MRGAAWCLVWLVGCGASAPAATNTIAPSPPARSNASPVVPPPPAPIVSAPPPSPPPPMLPTARTDAVSIAPDPALASAAAGYAQLARSPFSLRVPAVDVATGAREMAANIQAARAIALRVGMDCYPFESSPSPSQLAATLLHADADDFLASRIASADMPVPLDVAANARRLSPAERAELEQVLHDQMATLMSEQAHETFCQAAQLYQHALSIDPSSTRAAQQLAMYGEPFLRGCQ